MLELPCTTYLQLNLGESHYERELILIQQGVCYPHIYLLIQQIFNTVQPLIVFLGVNRSQLLGVQQRINNFHEERQREMVQIVDLG